MKKMYFLLGVMVGVGVFVQETSARDVPEYGIYDSYQLYSDRYGSQNYNNRPSSSIVDVYFADHGSARRDGGNIIYGGYNNLSNIHDTVNPSKLPLVTAQTKYPGCNRPDIVIGWQIWASCNALEKWKGSDSVSGWFFPGEMFPYYTSANGIGATLGEYRRFSRPKGWTVGPCAFGYRLPTRGEWETALLAARVNNVSISRMLALPYNGSYRGYRNIRNQISLDARINVGGAYWTGSPATDTPYVLHLDSDYLGYRTDGTDQSPIVSGSRLYETNGYELIPGESAEFANVRCIKS